MVPSLLRICQRSGSVSMFSVSLDKQCVISSSTLPWRERMGGPWCTTAWALVTHADTEETAEVVVLTTPRQLAASPGPTLLLVSISTGSPVTTFHVSKFVSIGSSGQRAWVGWWATWPRPVPDRSLTRRSSVRAPLQPLVAGPKPVPKEREVSIAKGRGGICMSEEAQEVVTVEVRLREVESRKPHSEAIGPIGEVRARFDC